MSNILSNPPAVPDASVDQVPNSVSAALALAGKTELSTINVALLSDAELILDQKNRPCVMRNLSGNCYAIPLFSREFTQYLRSAFATSNIYPRTAEIKELLEHFAAFTATNGRKVDVHYRVSKIPGGVEIDLGDDTHSRIRLRGGVAEIIQSGSESVFWRTEIMRELPRPAKHGNAKLLFKYLNVPDPEKLLLLALILFMLSTPKSESATFPILIIQGQQGSGKSFLSANILLKLIDPTTLSVQRFPSNAKDLAVSAQYAHLLAYDNVREITPHLADTLCMMSTGGQLSSRKLYTDDALSTLDLHCGLILNGIHEFIDQPDLAQRCLPISTYPISSDTRKSPKQLLEEFQQDLPVIFRGLIDLAAKCLLRLDEAVVISPERNYSFSQWLAALELVNGVQPGTYQSLYTMVLTDSQLDSLQGDIVGSAVLDFSDQLQGNEWFGTPAQLLQALSRVVPDSTVRSFEWPRYPSALSKRLRSLEGGLLSQGVKIGFTRGRERRITIQVLEGKQDA